MLDVTGDYRLIRPFLTSSLAAAALEVQQELRSLLIASNPKAHQPVFQPITAGFLGGVNSLGLEINNNIQRDHTDAKSLKHPTVDDMRLRLNLQERRTRDAELLAAASGAVSASLDLQATLEKVAEQAVQLLQLESSAWVKSCLPTSGPGRTQRSWSPYAI